MRYYSARFFKGRRRVDMVDGFARNLAQFLRYARLCASVRSADRFAVRYNYNGARYLPVECK